MKRHLLSRIFAAVILTAAVPSFAATVSSAAAPTSEAGEGRQLKVLAIGNSFSQDAAEQYLWELFDAAGIDAVIGNMYIGGCTLERHRNNAQNDAAAYKYRKIVGGVKTETKEMKLSDALAEEDWDVVTLQQASGKSGRYTTYQPYLSELISYVRKHCKNPNAEIYFHQTWAYSQDAAHKEFPLYRNDQQTMYGSIMRSVQCAMADCPQICGVIPSGTAIQNGRTTPLGDTFNRDGYHLEKTFGRYTAACTWFEALSGQSVVGNTYAPATITAEQKRLAQMSAHFAVQRPFSITAYGDMLIEERVDNLLSRMTLDEKIMQLNQYTAGRNDNINNLGETVGKIPAEIGSLIYFGEDPKVRNAIQRHAMEDSRLGIPVLFGFDVIHGFRTVYPIPLAQGASWNTELASKACADAAREAYYTGIDWTFSPMVDVARDPRWGRVAEGYGEDPYLTSQFSAASVRGYQGDDLAAEGTIAACLKHFVGYGASEAGRDYVPTEISRQTLWDTYLPPFEAGIKAGAATVMSSFNNLSGIPASADRYTMTDVLKKRWEHDGFVVSDWDAVRQLVNQGYAENDKAAGAAAFNAGLDMDMVDNIYCRHFAALLNEGRISAERIDDAVRRILRIKFRLGLFDRPYVEELPEEQRLLLPEARQTALQMAVESMVLLKNDNAALPLAAPSKIALTGPLADNGEDLLGSWYGRGRAADVTTVRQGLEKVYGKENILYREGADFETAPSAKELKAARALVGKADAVVLCLGERRKWSGENASRSEITVPAAQMELLKEVSAAARRMHKPVIVVLFNGRALDVTEIEPYADAMLEAWQPGITGGDAVAKLLCGEESPSGRLTLTFPRSVGQIPIYYNHRNSGRRGTQGLYQDIPSTPFYDFGYGLSYTTFEYGKPTLKALLKNGKETEIGTQPLKLADVARITASVEVRNTGSADSHEVVQWYITDPYCSITRPVRELKHFEKRMIKAGEVQTFTFDIDPMEDLGFVDGTGRHFIEGGKFTLGVGEHKTDFILE
ncbi:MAG: DUF4886 domain-containing protein [Alistipes sp.]|nr:DUF4886 domain-containing protein [Alistipes sp.]